MYGRYGDNGASILVVYYIEVNVSECAVYYRWSESDNTLLTLKNIIILYSLEIVLTMYNLNTIFLSMVSHLS